MKTIAIINMKGGCAKTTTAVNMAHILATDYEKKVLVIDNDKQGNLSKACGAWSYEKPSLADILTGAKNIEEVRQQTDTENLSVIPANMHLLTANLVVIKDEEIEQATIIKNQLDELQPLLTFITQRQLTDSKNKNSVYDNIRKKYNLNNNAKENKKYNVRILKDIFGEVI